MEDEPVTFTITEEIARAVLTHMNADHAADSLAMVRALTDVERATAAEAVSCTDVGIGFRISTPEGDVERVLGWDRPIEQRSDIRAAVVAMYERATGPAPH